MLSLLTDAIAKYILQGLEHPPSWHKGTFSMPFDVDSETLSVLLGTYNLATPNWSKAKITLFPYTHQTGPCRAAGGLQSRRHSIPLDSGRTT